MPCNTTATTPSAVEVRRQLATVCRFANSHRILQCTNSKRAIFEATNSSASTSGGIFSLHLSNPLTTTGDPSSPERKDNTQNDYAINETVCKLASLVFDENDSLMGRSSLSVTRPVDLQGEVGTYPRNYWYSCWPWLRSRLETRDLIVSPLLYKVRTHQDPSSWCPPRVYLHNYLKSSRGHWLMSQTQDW